MIPANQASRGKEGIRYYAQLVGKKVAPRNVATCCESQATRSYGALPEFIYSTSEDGESEIYVNLFVPSNFTTAHGTVITQATNFPVSGDVKISVSAATTIVLRIPSWVTSATVEVQIDERSATGKAGSYLKLPATASSVITASFPMGLRVSAYNGSSTSPPSCPSSDGPCARRLCLITLPVSLFAVRLTCALALELCLTLAHRNQQPDPGR
eukprot:SAG11_NODE_8098_length_1060_cov_1.709677_2_plen_212_part_00